MCTASWGFRTGGYHLLFNRDEKRTRSLALPPAIHERSGLAFLAPTDPDGGGTWLWVNAAGVSAALLNFYEADIRGLPTFPRSRGLLLQDLAGSRSTAELREALEGRDLSPYRPFWLLSLDRSSAAALWRWDGQELRDVSPTVQATPFHSTSSFANTEVVAARRAAYEAAQTAPEDLVGLRRLHHHQMPGREAFSICMERPDARTVSLSEVEVSADRVRLAYAARNGTGAAFEVPQMLELPLLHEP